MGDVTDAILDGDVCEICGEWLGDGEGFPQMCSACINETE